MSQYNPDRLERIYRRTDGRCHICRKKLSLVNYGRAGERGAWQIDHSRARVKGGSDHLNNLFPACIPSNLEWWLHAPDRLREAVASLEDFSTPSAHRGKIEPASLVNA